MTCFIQENDTEKCAETQEYGFSDAKKDGNSLAPINIIESNQQTSFISQVMACFSLSRNFEKVFNLEHSPGTIAFMVISIKLSQ